MGAYPNAPSLGVSPQAQADYNQKLTAYNQQLAKINKMPDYYRTGGSGTLGMIGGSNI